MAKSDKEKGPGTQVCDISFRVKERKKLSRS